MKTKDLTGPDMFRLAYGDYRIDGSKREFEERDGYMTKIPYQFALRAGHAYLDGPIIGYETRVAYRYTEKPINSSSVPCKIYREILADGKPCEWAGHTGRISEVVPDGIDLTKHLK